MTIYYNPAYSASPYRKNENRVDIGNAYCGDIQLLQRLLFYAGIPYLPASDEERLACYHKHMQGKVNESSPFYNSYTTDSAGMGRAVLAWRDALVGVGWNVKAYAGESFKLSLLHDVEPEKMLPGEADYWYTLIRIASEGRILPEGFKVVVTCKKQEIKPHIAYILERQQEAGVPVEFRTGQAPCATGNLGKIQKAVIGEAKEKIVLDKNDDTFCYISFVNEDDALRYVATESIDESAVYFCSQPKRFDNTLRLLGKPTIGSSMTTGTPQVVQLFMLGNGLFEYPLNINRIIEWLNLPVSPIYSGLRKALGNALASSGGINNAEWNKAKEAYLETVKGTAVYEKAIERYDMFLPLPQTEKVDTEAVKLFNDNLCKWAEQQLANKNFRYDEIVREQIASVANYCSSLLKMLDEAPAELDFLDLQLWCRNIAKAGTYAQYDAEVGSHTTIATMGDIHDVADSILWFTAKDDGVAAYPFEILNNDEYDEVEKSGALPYKRVQHSLMNRAVMRRILLNAKKLTIIEAEKSKGERIARHPLILQLNEHIQGGLESIVQHEGLNTVMEKQVINRGENKELVQLGDEVTLKERHERETDITKQAESYSSLSQLIQHPFTYVCERCVQLKDKVMPSAQDKDATLGNVAHLVIEKVFGGRTIDEVCCFSENEYERIFEESVDEKGLLLRLPEYTGDLLRLKNKMKEALGKLAVTIKNNNLTVDACEYEFKHIEWKGVGKDVTLGSRADMLLSDKEGGKVIFDFKYSRSRSRFTEVEENRALQLEVYRFMAKQEFGTNKKVRVAYVLLPDVTIVTADEFEGVTKINLKPAREKSDVISEAAKSYRFRWEQLKSGEIERVEGCSPGTGKYAEKIDTEHLFPLITYKVNNKEVYSTDKFDKGYKNLK